MFPYLQLTIPLQHLLPHPHEPLHQALHHILPPKGDQEDIPPDQRKEQVDQQE